MPSSGLIRGWDHTWKHARTQHRADSEGMNWKVLGSFQLSGTTPHERVREKQVWATRDTMQTSPC